MSDCDRPAKVVDGMCSMHAQRVTKHGDPSVVLYTKGDTGEAHPSWRGDEITYSGAHMRVRATRGSATGHPCVDCADPAEHWSYNHDDPNERTSDEGPYSADVTRYSPRCVPCHKAFDLARL